MLKQFPSENVFSGQAAMKFEAPLTLAMKQLEGRRPQINVHWLCFPADGLILELPQSFEMFKVRNFSPWSSNNPLIDRFIDLNSSMPLQLIVLSNSLELLVQKLTNTKSYKLLEGCCFQLSLVSCSTPSIEVEVDEGVEVIDFLIVIDALLQQQDLKDNTHRCFVIHEANLVSDLFKVFTLLAEGEDPVIYDDDDEDGEDEYARCDEFPNEIAFSLNDAMFISADVKRREDDFVVKIWISKQDKSLKTKFFE